MFFDRRHPYYKSYKDWWYWNTNVKAHAVKLVTFNMDDTYNRVMMKLQTLTDKQAVNIIKEYYESHPKTAEYFLNIIDNPKYEWPPRDETNSDVPAPPPHSDQYMNTNQQLVFHPQQQNVMPQTQYVQNPGFQGQQQILPTHLIHNQDGSFHNHQQMIHYGQQPCYQPNQQMQFHQQNQQMQFHPQNQQFQPQGPGSSYHSQLPPMNYPQKFDHQQYSNQNQQAMNDYQYGSYQNQNFQSYPIDQSVQASQQYQQQPIHYPAPVYNQQFQTSPQNPPQQFYQQQQPQQFYQQQQPQHNWNQNRAEQQQYQQNWTPRSYNQKNYNFQPRNHNYRGNQFVGNSNAPLARTANSPSHTETTTSRRDSDSTTNDQEVLQSVELNSEPIKPSANNDEKPKDEQIPSKSSENSGDDTTSSIEQLEIVVKPDESPKNVESIPISKSANSKEEKEKDVKKLNQSPNNIENLKKVEFSSNSKVTILKREPKIEQKTNQSCFEKLGIVTQPNATSIKRTEKVEPLQASKTEAVKEKSNKDQCENNRVFFEKKFAPKSKKNCESQSIVQTKPKMNDQSPSKQQNPDITRPSKENSSAKSANLKNIGKAAENEESSKQPSFEIKEVSKTLEAEDHKNEKVGLSYSDALKKKSENPMEIVKKPPKHDPVTKQQDRYQSSSKAHKPIQYFENSWLNLFGDMITDAERLDKFLSSREESNQNESNKNQSKQESKKWVESSRKNQFQENEQKSSINLEKSSNSKKNAIVETPILQSKPKNVQIEVEKKSEKSLEENPNDDEEKQEIDSIEETSSDESENEDEEGPSTSTNQVTRRKNRSSRRNKKKREQQKLEEERKKKIPKSFVVEYRGARRKFDFSENADGLVVMEDNDVVEIREIMEVAENKPKKKNSKKSKKNKNKKSKKSGVRGKQTCGNVVVLQDSSTDLEEDDQFEEIFDDFGGNNEQPKIFSLDKNSTWVIYEISVLLNKKTCGIHPDTFETYCVIFENWHSKESRALNLCFKCTEPLDCLIDDFDLDIFKALAIQTVVQEKCPQMTIGHVEKISPYLEASRAAALSYAFGKHLNFSETRRYLSTKHLYPQFQSKIKLREGELQFESVTNFLDDFEKLKDVWTPIGLLVARVKFVHTCILKFKQNMQNKTAKERFVRMVWDRVNADRTIREEVQFLALHSARPGSCIDMFFVTLFEEYCAQQSPPDPK
ncbi:unnamed protein product [Caenorhabditis angaria]|uniref:Uncharacterized protein n=1 Tax=Caenorhabditis angaria TaxID=860376 RepID=A0A9P1J3J8_9PELO|nr:unnamed protein product [Caenorhabditis angaria]